MSSFEQDASFENKTVYDSEDNSFLLLPDGRMIKTPYNSWFDMSSQFYRRKQDYGRIYEVGFEYCQTSKGPIQRIPEYAVLHYIFDGEGYLNGQSLHTGQGFLIPKGHHAKYAPSSQKPWSYIWFCFEYEDFPEANCLGKTICTFEAPQAEMVSRLLISALERIESFPDRPLLMDRILRLALAGHAKQEAPQSRSSSSRELHVEEAILWIEKHYFEKISIMQLAQQMHLNRAYLRNLFLWKLGVSPQEYLLQYRLKTAKRLLRETSYSVSQIASSVGYSDQIQFSRIFKKKVGLSPSQYRKDSHTPAFLMDN